METTETCPIRQVKQLGFKKAFHRFHYVPVDDLEVRAVAVRRVFGFLAGAQHGRFALLGGEAQRGDARGFALVGPVAEWLKEKIHKTTLSLGADKLSHGQR